MKKGFLILAMILLLVSFAGADAKVLIDFSLLTADTADANGNMTQNQRTVMDYSNIAGSTYTDDQKALMSTSLAIENWDVVLNSSARTVESMSVSMAKEAQVSDSSSRNAGQVIMGVRTLFPAGPYNANVTIKPPFEIPAYEPMEEGGETVGAETRFENGYGVIKNVGVIKKIAVEVLGRNFPHALYVQISNENMDTKKIYMGNLQFDGWRTLEWVNPQYVSEVRNRELRLYPMYPQSTPFYKFDSFIVARDAAHVGGDFVGYFKDVKMIYDKALLDAVSDVDDEDLWGIIKDREDVRKNNEVRRFGNIQVLRFLEQQKQATEDDFSSLEGGETAAAETATE